MVIILAVLGLLVSILVLDCTVLVAFGYYWFKLAGVVV